MWMNRMDIEEAYGRYGQQHTPIGNAVRFLKAFMEEVDSHSDGWPYWSAPSKAADKLMNLIHGYMWRGMGAYPDVPAPTMADVLKCMPPIKSFMTRRGLKAGMKMPELN